MFTEKRTMITTPRRVYREPGYRRHHITATYGMNKLGNQIPYFAITANITHFNGAVVAGGCMHDSITKWFPHLKALIPFHLWDQSGCPMHFYSNTNYLRDANRWDSVGRYLQLEPTSERIALWVNMDKAHWNHYLRSRLCVLRKRFHLAMKAYHIRYIQ